MKTLNRSYLADWLDRLQPPASLVVGGVALLAVNTRQTANSAVRAHVIFAVKGVARAITPVARARRPQASRFANVPSAGMCV